MSLAIWKLEREKYEGLTTLGSLYRPDGSLFCYVLEDVVRAYGIKDKGMTAIPATGGDDTFFLRVMESGKYDTAVTVFTDMVNGVPDLNYGGVSFSYIRAHGGNSHEASQGCLLVSKYRDMDKMTAWSSQLIEFRNEVKKMTLEGFDCRLRIINKPQKG